MLTRAEWLEAKRGYLGASEWAGVLDKDPYKTPLTIYAAKVHGVQTEPTDVMEFGLEIENFVATRYVKYTGREVHNPGATTLQVHPDYPWLAATLDRQTREFVTSCGPLELKTVQSYKIRIEDWWEGGPLHYQMQLQAQMACTGAQWGSLAGLFFPGVRLAWVDHVRNDRFINSAIPKLERFWFDYIVAKIPPEPTSARDLPAVKRIYPGDDGSTVMLTDSELTMVGQLELDRDRKKEATQKIEHTEAILRARLGDATFGALPDGSYLVGKTQTDGKRPLKRWRP